MRTSVVVPRHRQPHQIADWNAWGSFKKMRATIDITGTKIDPNQLPPELRVKIGTEKPPGSKDEANIIVRQPPRQL